MLLSIIGIVQGLVGSVLAQETMTEWNIRSWCWRLDLLLEQYFKVTMSVHCHKLYPEMTLYVARTDNSNNQGHTAPNLSHYLPAHYTSTGDR